ncbi:MAG: class I SAM-dependent methyltransferase [Gemmatimonadales bacterium]
MKEAYASIYRELYRRHWWWRAREAVLVREIARNAPPQGWGRILDVGCGDALFFDELSRFGEVWGVEGDPSLVRDDGPYRHRIHVGKFDASLPTGSPFRLVLMLDVLEHMHEPVDALQRVRALLEPSGALLVTVPAFPAAWTRHDDYNEHVVRYTRASFKEVVRRAGLTLLSSRYLFHWLFPAKLLVRAAESVISGAAVPAGIPPVWLNKALFSASRLEERLLRWARLPFGTSLLAWCIPSAVTVADPFLAAAGPPGLRKII